MRLRLLLKSTSSAVIPALIGGVVIKSNENAINVSAEEINILGPQRRDHSSGPDRFHAAGTKSAAQKRAAGLTPMLAVI
jgi:hypothetical protein